MTEVTEMLIKREELQSLDKNGRPCEVCKQHMHDHEWAVLNVEGFVVNCSNES